MNALVPTVEQLQLYYSGFHAIARYVPDKEHWECTVVDSADPIDFRIQEKDKLQETLVQYIEDYRTHCKTVGRALKKSVLS